VGHPKIAEKSEQTIKLNDGRNLGFAEYGDPTGKPIFEFHGNPSSRLGGVLFAEAACRRGIRVIGVDRPGIGLSDYKRGGKLLEWPDDVLEPVQAHSGISRSAWTSLDRSPGNEHSCSHDTPKAR
jgi:pimeloyl-ACP methyl ester carboxylesterase